MTAVNAWEIQGGYWEKLLPRRVVQHWNRLPEDVRDSLFVGGSKTWLDKAMTDLSLCWQQSCILWEAGPERHPEVLPSRKFYDCTYIKIE